MREIFGGDWSDKKLLALESYLTAYCNVMQNQSFKVAYIDAFAGAGVREKTENSEEEQPQLWVEENPVEDQDYRHGSPLIALDTQSRFDRFIFMEKDADSLIQLREQVKLRSDDLQKKVIFQSGDANECLKDLCDKDWKSHRAVAFLDPFALQVDWETIEAIAKTEAIDMWLLFPAMAVNRMLPKNAAVPKEWSFRLDQLFGEKDWREAFYQKEQLELLQEETTVKTPEIFNQISAYVTSRLESVFAGVAKTPLILTNKNGAPLFLLCFAAGNKNGAKIAVKIANHIINKSA